MDTQKRPLTTETKTVHRKTGKTFLQRFHTIGGKPTAIPIRDPHDFIPVNSEVRFKRPYGTSYTKGFVVAVHPESGSYTVETPRLETGRKLVIKVPHGDVISYEDWAKYRYVTPKSAAQTGEGDRNRARNVLSAEELRRRKDLVEKRLGVGEAEILLHPSVVGPAIKITAELAGTNDIPVVVSNDRGLPWDRAVNPEHRNLINTYLMSAMLTWRRMLAGDLDAQTRENVKQFKDVLLDKRPSSYIHEVMKREGKTAVIKYLQERQEEKDLYHDEDIHDMELDPRTRALLEKHSSAPQQFRFTLAANDETLQSDVARLVAKLPPIHQELVRMKFGFPPYRAPDNGTTSYEDVADRMNSKGHLTDEGKKWNRNTVAAVIDGVTKQLFGLADEEEALRQKYWNPLTGRTRHLKDWTHEDLERLRHSQAVSGIRMHIDEQMGRPIWKAEDEDGAAPDPAHDALLELFEEAREDHERQLLELLGEELTRARNA